MGTNFGEELMGRMAEIDANLRELPDYEKGVQAERERIIKLLENETLEATPENHGLEYDKLVWAGIREQLIALIKGENLDGCEPADLPCVNGFSCQKHEKTIEELLPFITGENK